MNLDELQSVQARERQSSDLQHLRSSFYAEVGAFIEELQAERARIVEETDDPFSSPEVRRISDDIETTEGTVEAIYERRVGKVVKKASIAAAGMPVDDDGLTAEEEQLFEALVSQIERNRETVLSVLDGDAPNVSCSITDGDDAAASESAASADAPPTDAASASETPPTDRADGVNAADLMGGDEPPSSDGDGERSSVSSELDGTGGENPRASTQHSANGPAPDGANPDGTTADGSTERTEIPPDSSPPGTDSRKEIRGTADAADAGETGDGDRDVPGIPRTTVRITSDVGEMVGADNRDYELGAEDVVTLPEPNADVLVDKNAAERLE